jgi:hypothetical protein
MAVSCQTLTRTRPVDRRQRRCFIAANYACGRRITVSCESNLEIDSKSMCCRGSDARARWRLAALVNGSGASGVLVSGRAIEPSDARFRPEQYQRLSDRRRAGSPCRRRQKMPGNPQMHQNLARENAIVPRAAGTIRLLAAAKCRRDCRLVRAGRKDASGAWP